jgi:hypothetical protein
VPARPQQGSDIQLQVSRVQLPHTVLIYVHVHGILCVGLTSLPEAPHVDCSMTCAVDAACTRRTASYKAESDALQHMPYRSTRCLWVRDPASTLELEPQAALTSDICNDIMLEPS